jgi:hypothetical protein
VSGTISLKGNCFRVELRLNFVRAVLKIPLGVFKV